MRYAEFKESADGILGAIMGKAGAKPDADIFGLAGVTAPSNNNNSPIGNIGNFDNTPTTGSNPSSGDSMLPVKGRITSPFGMRQRGMHNGTDFGVPIGTPVLAPDDGVVWMAGSNGSAGIMVAINSGNTQHKLMHLSQIKVQPGEKVKKGQVVGLSGNTGLSTGPHLHWEKHVAGRATDPMRNIG